MADDLVPLTVPLPLPPDKVRLPCRRCRQEEAGGQIFNLLTVDQERYIHQYMCERCGIHERLTTHFAFSVRVT